MENKSTVILVENLCKYFGKFKALDKLNLRVIEGSIVAVLGPNGAGKTTLVRCLTTLLLPDTGHIEVAGYDVIKYPDKVRASIGLTGQYAAVDDRLTGVENLEMFGHLYHLPRKEVKIKAKELLEQLDLIDAAKKLVKTYSGGMRRRLDLAVSLIKKPQILFLDEPTTGLDPRARLAVWGLVRELVARGTTVFLTTQYLEEADHLADHIAVMDHGRVIAEGTSDQLKKQVGGERLEISIVGSSDKKAAYDILSQYSVGKKIQIDEQGCHFTLPLSKEEQKLTSIIRDFEAANIIIDDINLRRPTLDEVFLSFTGHDEKLEN